LSQAEPAPTISEYEREQRATRAIYEWLKAERLARVADETACDKSGLLPTPDISRHRNTWRYVP
jgi:hypothetical protein